MYRSSYSISAHLLIPEIENTTDHTDFKIQSTQPGLQIYTTLIAVCWLLSVGLSESIDNFKKTFLLIASFK